MRKLMAAVARAMDIGPPVAWGFTLIEWLIVVIIAGIAVAIPATLVGDTKPPVSVRCAERGYVVINEGRYPTAYCSKVENGNTIVVHVDSLK